MLLDVCSEEPLDRLRLALFDLSLGGPSVLTVADAGPGPGTLAIPRYGVGRYTIADRDVFRPLQYCAVNILFMGDGVEWLARDIVEMSSGHIEALVKRVGKLRFLPLGTAIRKASVKRALDPATWDQVVRFVPVYNSSKHDFDHDKDTHLYSLSDALTAYFVCRRLGAKLYPHAGLTTSLTVFDGAPFPSLPELQAYLA